MQIKLENGAEVEINGRYTRRIDREYTKLLFENCDTETNQKWEVKFKVEPSNMAVWDDYLVEQLTNLTQKEIDDLSVSDYEKVLKEVHKLKNPSWK